VLVEAARRIDNPEEVSAGPMLVVAIAGLGANLFAFWLLRPGAGESLNLEGAYLEVLSDLVGSVGVIVAALVISATEWTWVDPVVGVAIGVFILPRTWRLGSKALRILVQAAPPGIDVSAIADDLAAIAGVVDVHDLHVWTLTSDMEVATAHVMVTAGSDHHQVLDQARSVLRDRHGIDHATLQVEPDDHEGCADVDW
jgi:cobalt-zinc-cadmium efflux system protein